MASSMVEDGVRAVRLVAFSIAATVLALGAHVLAGGTPPAVPVTVAAIVAPAVVGRALVRRRRQFVEIAVVLGAVQLLLHEVFDAFPATSATGGAAGHGGHVGHATHPWMPVTHVAAVLITAALLAHGERVFDLLQAWWRAVPVIVCWPIPIVIVPTGTKVPIDTRPRRPMTSRWVCAPLVRRGPPAVGC